MFLIVQLEKSIRNPKLVPEKRTVTRNGVTFQQTVWVDPTDKNAKVVQGGFDFDSDEPRLGKPVRNPDEFEHAGIKIYKVRNIGWAVQSERNIGTNDRFGDALFDDPEAAKKYAEFESKRRVQTRVRAERQKQIDEERLLREEERKAANRGLSISERRAKVFLEKHLESHTYGGRHPYKVMDEDGARLEKVETDHMSDWNRKKYNRMDNDEQKAYEDRLRRPKTEYRMYTPEGSFYEIPATLFSHLAKKYPKKVKTGGDTNSKESTQVASQDGADKKPLTSPRLKKLTAARKLIMADYENYKKKAKLRPMYDAAQMLKKVNSDIEIERKTLEKHGNVKNWSEIEPGDNVTLIKKPGVKNWHPDKLTGMVGAINSVVGGGYRMRLTDNNKNGPYYDDEYLITHHEPHEEVK